MSNALRGRINQLADRMEFAAECKLSMRPTKEQAADIRALLAAHRKAERELAIRRVVEWMDGAVGLLARRKGG